MGKEGVSRKEGGRPGQREKHTEAGDARQPVL